MTAWTPMVSAAGVPLTISTPPTMTAESSRRSSSDSTQQLRGRLCGDGCSMFDVEYSIFGSFRLLSTDYFLTRGPAAPPVAHQSKSICVSPFGHWELVILWTLGHWTFVI